MNIVKRDTLHIDALPGRDIQRAIGMNSASPSTSMRVGYATASSVMLLDMVLACPPHSMVCLKPAI